MKTTNYLHKLLLAVVGLLTSVTASAQFTKTLELPVSAEKFDALPVEFSLTEVATTLATDTATLVKALNDWTAGTDDLFYLVDPNDATILYNDYTQGGKGGFWVLNTGVPAAWGTEGLTWYNTLGWDAPQDKFVINIGQYPDVAKVGDTYKPVFLMKYNGKEAKFEVTIQFVESTEPVYEIPEPAALKEAALNVVGEKVVTVEQYPRGDYTADQMDVVIDDLLDKLGISDANLLANKIGDLLYCTEFDTETVNKRDSVTNQSTAGAPGFWVTDIRVDGEATGECAAAAYSQGCMFFAEGFSFNAETNTVSFRVGQYPSKLKGEEKFFVNFYIIYGDKAYRIRLDFNCLYQEPGETLEDYTKVGEESVTVENVPGGYNDAKILRPDMEAIAAALGCEVGDITLAGLSSEVDFGNSTANAGGFWFNIDGYVCPWGDNAMYYVEPFTAGDYTELKLGQYPGHMNVGDETTFSLYFLGGRNYYQYTVNFRIKEQKVIDGLFESVAKRTFVFQQVPAGYTWSEGIDIPNEWIEEMIGTADWTLYALAVLDENGNEPEGNARYVKNYTITEAPGFWLNKDGRNSGHGDNSVFGLSVGNAPNMKGKISMIQMPDKCQAGETYTAQIFFVNEETAKMVTVNLVYNIVNEVIDFENVGSEDIMLPVSYNESKAVISLAAAADSLGVSVADLIGNEYLCGMTESGVYSGGQMGEDGLAFNAQGFFDQVNPAVSFNMESDGDEVTVTAWSEEEIAEDFRLSTLFCFQIDNKQYVFNVKFVSDEEYAEYVTGIGNVAAKPASSGKVYDLSGRQVMKPARGLYIVDGKKVVLK